MSITLRPMIESDWPAADLVARAAFERDASFLPYLALHTAIQPDGMWVAADNGAVVGTVTAIDYGTVGYIGIMTVRPDYQSRGLGRALLAKALGMLDDRQCSIALLDATEKGARLYETVEFVDDSLAQVYDLPPGVSPLRPTRTGTTARLAEVKNLESIVACDAIAFGGNREKLLKALWPAHQSRCLVVADGKGNVAGYLFARDGLWGPWVAMTHEAAEELLVAALALPRSQTPLVMVPRSNPDCQRLLGSYGFVERRRLRHMRRGGKGPPGKPQKLFGQSSFGHG